MTSGALPLGDDPDAISRVLWELTDREYKRAAPAFLNVKTNTAVRAEEEDKSPDFSKQTPQMHTGEPLTVPGFDRTAWEGEIRRLSGAFRKYAEVYSGTVIAAGGDFERAAGVERRHDDCDAERVGAHGDGGVNARG